MFKILSLQVGVLATNCYIAFDTNSREAAVVDPGGAADEILETIRREHLTVRYIFLTHGHFDHILALDGVKAATGAEAVLHEAERGTDAEADILTRQGDTFPVGAYSFEVLHTPGHTPGSLCLRVRTQDGSPDVLFTGDTLFEGGCGRCDLPGGDDAAMRASLRVLAALDGDCLVYPGHDISTTLSREREKNDAMREALEGFSVAKERGV